MPDASAAAPVPASRAAAFAELIRQAARLDRTQSDPVVAARNALGVALPLIVGTLAGNVALGLASTIGALQVAFADRPGPYRLRMLRMSTCALIAALTSGLAVAFSRSDAASVVLLLVLGFCAGLLLTAGPSGAQMGVAGTAAAIVLGHTPQPASVAVHVGLLVLLGGAVQVVLAIAAWPLRRHLPERRALAGLYRALAGMGRQPPGTHVAPPLVDPLTSVRATLYGLGHDHGPSVEAYRVLLDEAERIRREVLVLSAQAERLSRGGADSAADALRSVLSGAGDVLDEIAGALDEARALDPSVVAVVRGQVEDARKVLQRAEVPGGEVTRRAAVARLPSLLGQLRAAVETARAGASEGARDPYADDAVSGVSRLRDPMAILRANLAPDSAVLRHAMRLAALVAGSDLVVRLAGINRGYWVPLTVLVVLRPDFGSTFQRSVMRVLGTIVGLLLATALLHWVPGGPWWSVALVAAFFFGMRLAGPGNLALSAMSIGGLVVVLLSLAGIPSHTTVVDRAVDTVIGGALALAATLLWPVWERERVPARLADLLADYQRYLDAIADPDGEGSQLQRARAAARLARTNAQASVDRARSEPVAGQRTVELGEAVLAHTHRFIHAMLILDALRTSARNLPEVVEFLELAGRALDRAEHAVRATAPPRGVPKLRPAQQRLADALIAEPQRAGSAETSGALVEASDRIANSLDTLVSELHRQLAARPSP